MSSCSSDLLSAYLDASLALPERRRLEEHLKTCAPCREELEALTRVDRLLAVWGSRRVPVPLQTDAKIARSVERRGRFAPILALSRMVPAAVGSSIAALLVLVSVNAGLLYQQGQVAVSTPSTHPQRSFVTQSRPLVNARRAAAIQGVVIAEPEVVARPRMQFDFN